MDLQLDTTDHGEIVEMENGSQEKKTKIEIDRPQQQHHSNRKPRPKRKKVSWGEVEQENTKDMFDTLQSFSNPEKKLNESKISPAPPPPSYDPEDNDEEEDDDDMIGHEEDEEYDDDDEDQLSDVNEEMEYVTSKEPSQEEQQPSEGYATLEDERSDIICKLERMRKRGMKNIRQFSLYSNITEMRSELARVTREVGLESSLKFQKKMLIALVSGLELANKRFNPLDLHLDGFSEHTMENIGDYTSIFEQLYFKYRSSLSTPPEIQLLMTLGSSMFMFHLSNTFFRQGGADKLMENPAFVQEMAKAMAQQQQQQSAPPPQQQPAQPGQRREISPPSFDFGNIFGQPQVQTPMQHPVNTRGDLPTATTVQPPIMQEQQQDQEDRLSDIISDIGSVPSEDEKIVEVPDATKRKKKKQVVTNGVMII
jgi:hypothetical protein